MGRKHSPESFDAASKRLAEAFDYLEKVTRAASSRSDSASADFEAEMTRLRSDNDFLKDDNARLSNQLQDLQRDYLKLKEVTSKAANRLDRQVEQLDLIAGL